MTTIPPNPKPSDNPAECGFNPNPAGWRERLAKELSLASELCEMPGNDHQIYRNIERVAEVLANALGAIKHFNPRRNIPGIHRNTRDGFMIVGCYPFNPPPPPLPAKPPEKTPEFTGGVDVSKGLACRECGSVHVIQFGPLFRCKDCGHEWPIGKE